MGRTPAAVPVPADGALDDVVAILVVRVL